MNENIDNNEETQETVAVEENDKGCRYSCCGTRAVRGGKLHVYDWLEDLPEPPNASDLVEVQFKNTRKAYYRNTAGLALKKGDLVAVESSPGHDIGEVTLQGRLVYLQMYKNRINPETYEFKRVYRVARATDIEKWEEAKGLEQSTMLESRQIAERLNLNMKIGDVEYQGDRTKAIFYYIADERVDFRELIKVLADRFKVRIEMKQIGARQEAGRIGGIGPCGRELCCASWMTSFVSVTTHSARIQDISLNPLKLAGQCGKLKCCLNYELDVYLDAIQDFPPTEKPLDTDEGLFYFLKYDIFKKIMYYSSKKDAPVNMVALDIERVAEIQKMNEEGHRPDKIGGKETAAMSEDVGYSGVVELDDLTRFDDKNRKKKGSRNRNNSKGSNRQNNNDRNPQNDTRRQRNNDSHNRDNSQSQNVGENDQRHDNATNTEPHNGNRNRQRDNRRGQNGRERRHRDNDGADSNNDGNNEQK